jgi:hypothetical protein
VGEEYPDIEEFYDYVTDIGKKCMEIHTILSSMLDYEIDTSYAGVYDNFKTDIIEKIKFGVPAENDFTDILSVITSVNVNSY